MTVSLTWKDYMLYATFSSADNALLYVKQLVDDYARDRKELTRRVMSTWSAPGECDPDADTELDVVIYHDFRKMRLVDNVKNTSTVISASSLAG